MTADNSNDEKICVSRYTTKKGLSYYLSCTALSRCQENTVKNICKIKLVLQYPIEHMLLPIMYVVISREVPLFVEVKRKQK